MVERYPEAVKVGDMGTMYPDLLARRDEQNYYIEAEMPGIKNAEQTARKWQRVFVATQGRVYVSVPLRGDLESVRSSINHYGRDYPEVKVTYMVVDTALGLLDKVGDQANVWQI